MNIYRTKFFCECPLNGARVEYAWTLETKDMIFAEDLLKHITGLQPSYHEDLADGLAVAWGGRQTLEAHHHGVDITTVRGAV